MKSIISGLAVAFLTSCSPDLLSYGGLGELLVLVTMLYVFCIILILICLIVCVVGLADRLGRNPFGYFILSLFVSPFVVLILLWCLGETYSHKKSRLEYEYSVLKRVLWDKQ